jgi:hypothetical protein
VIIGQTGLSNDAASEEVGALLVDSFATKGAALGNDVGRNDGEARASGENNTVQVRREPKILLRAGKVVERASHPSNVKGRLVMKERRRCRRREGCGGGMELEVQFADVPDGRVEVHRKNEIRDWDGMGETDVQQSRGERAEKGELTLGRGLPGKEGQLVSPGHIGRGGATSEAMRSKADGASDGDNKGGDS